ncbi:hypothetical protein JTE90_015768 [Oedothorax gibbosus]|uniref:NADH dehydrogenase [ubiquinone] 1 beta subcomplex subunit 3 n=1 Tax=Oedothorax gibbosus TaxID=931172 RepID=A0AAV6VXG6_9ARAC|nr:hypothetical protein JTE90_015768 [Oedothorax gibbosus]
MGGGHPPEVPDYRIYKVKGVRQLERVQRMLAQHGLTDPWLRNEVWRYPPGSSSKPWKLLNETMFRRIGVGFCLAVATVIGEKIYHHYYPEKPHHH